MRKKPLWRIVLPLYFWGSTVKNREARDKSTQSGILLHCTNTLHPNEDSALESYHYALLRDGLPSDSA